MPARPMTLTQKILAEHAIGLSRPWVQAGDLLRIRVDWTLASELAWNGMDRTYEALGRPPIYDPGHFFLAVDHTVDPVTLASDARTQKLVKLSRDFAREQKIVHFHDSNETILHTQFYRELIQPGEVVLGADSHTSSHGGMGAFAIGLGGADITAAMVLGQSWIEVPEAISIEYRGELPFGIGGKDVILRTLGLLKRNTVAMERTVEYRGPATRSFSTDVRFTIANMTAELGGLNGLFEPDARVATWLAGRQDHRDGARFLTADEDAPYVAREGVDLSGLAPQVAKPFSPDNVVEVTSIAGLGLHGCFIGACTTTEEELVLGALVLEQKLAGGPPVATAKRLVVPGDLAITEKLRAAGLLATYERAGFRIGPPGCSMCLGVASEKAGPGEVWLSSQNRNFHDRMGAGSLAHLASAATVAASAVAMKIEDPRPALARVDRARYARLLGGTDAARVPEVRRDEVRVQIAAAWAAPAVVGSAVAAPIAGRVQRFGDDVDTDAIIPGEFCHLTTLPELGRACFRHARPDFGDRIARGEDVIVAGSGWGSGSSREQAVWALIGAGVAAVIARSFAFIHKRNLVNEGLAFLVVSDPEFHALVKDGDPVEIDLARSHVKHLPTGRMFTALPPSPVVAALRREGGLVEAIRRHGRAVFETIAGG